ncbi:MAG: aldo/keto reductase, partial [Oscillospiraceae bacterium]|nr:aldo/keto reductase [Oscillospiraceae bacterium]
MQYRKDKYGNPISILGYGCMRFTRTAGGVDMKKTEKELLQAIEAGVNYFDTAYIYPGSEAALGEILERNGLRDKVKIATKLPHYLIKDAAGLEKTFQEELRRLRTDHVDYYLMHMLTDVKTWERLKGLGIEDWLRQKQEEGSIRQVGFSYHGNSDMFLSLLEARDWDFCQIQYNYLDENSQAGVTGLKAAAAKGIPVVIMEPLRGGKLANKLPKEAEAL